MASALQKQHKEIVRLTVERDAWRKAFDALWAAYKSQCELVAAMDAMNKPESPSGRQEP